MTECTLHTLCSSGCCWSIGSSCWSSGDSSVADTAAEGNSIFTLWFIRVGELAIKSTAAWKKHKSKGYYEDNLVTIITLARLHRLRILSLLCDVYYGSDLRSINTRTSSFTRCVNMITFLLYCFITQNWWWQRSHVLTGETHPPFKIN